MRLPIILINLILLVVILVSDSFSQTSIGFSNPQDTKALLDYRLPTWGYRDLKLDLYFNTTGYNREHNYDYESYSRSSSCYLNTSPDFTFYRESEKDVTAFSGSFYLYRHEWTQNTKYYESGMETETKDWYGTSNLSFSTRHYLPAERYFSFSAQSSSYYSEEDEKLKGHFSYGGDVDSTYGHYRRYYDNNVKLGFGFGRIRNVTPLIQAARLAERLKALDGNRSLNAEEIQLVAQSFAKRSGYYTIFDRAEKNFWSDLLKPINRFQPLTPFELLYLTDAVYENIGYRTEGWNCTIGIELRNHHEKEKISQSNFTGLFLDTQWSHNLSMTKQLSFGGNLFLGKELNDERIQLQMRELEFYGNYLWNLTDRILWSTTVQPEINYFQNKKDPDLKLGYLDKMITINSIFDFYIEDHLGYSIGFGYQYSRPDKKNMTRFTSDFSINMRATWYLGRKLF